MISCEIETVFDLFKTENLGEKTNRDETILFYALRYQIMTKCWQNEPKARPSFTALTKQLRDMENQHKVGLLVPCDLKSISATSAMTTISRL